jgi:hypothetical protein
LEEVAAPAPRHHRRRGCCLDGGKNCLFNVLHIVPRFICLWQILSYHGLTRLKRFVSQSTSKPCN